MVKKSVLLNQLLNLTWFVSIAAFLYCCLSFLKNDYWQDELYTLDQFVFVPWTKVAFDYHSTNNHLLFNALIKLFANFAGIYSLKDALAKPHVLRILPVLFSVSNVIVLYLYAKDAYGKSVSMLAVSILCTSVVFVDFSAQLRGYSAGMFLQTLLYFIFLGSIEREWSIWGPVKLTLVTIATLLCLPTNFYFIASLALISLTLYIYPSFGMLLFSRAVKRSKAAWLFFSLLGGSIACGLFYSWLLSLQPANELINTFHLLQWKNLAQFFAVFFHFTDYRFYFYFILLLWLFALLKFSRRNWQFLLPALCFGLPFVFFFIHGAIIIQRVFVPLLPFYSLFMAIVLAPLLENAKKWIVILFYLVNAGVLLVSFGWLHISTKDSHANSLHQHDLRQHYYLVGFNARESTNLVLAQVRKYKMPLFVFDDFGETGIFYYLKQWNIPFKNDDSYTAMKKPFLLLTNNKEHTENILSKMGGHYSKYYADTKHYNLYWVIPNQY